MFPDRQEYPGTSRVVNFYFLFSYPPPPPPNSYRNNCSKARTWKEERQRLMRINKYLSLTPRDHGGKEFSTPRGLFHAQPSSPVCECIWHLKCPEPPASLIQESQKTNSGTESSQLSKERGLALWSRSTETQHSAIRASPAVPPPPGAQRALAARYCLPAFCALPVTVTRPHALYAPAHCNETPWRARINYLSEKMAVALMSPRNKLALLPTTAQVTLYPLNLALSGSDGCHTATLDSLRG